MNNPIEYFQNSELIVHAGGLSERWFPVTGGRIPKPITDIGKKSRPMLDWVILPYVMAGLKKIFVSLWHNPDQIVEHCDEMAKNTGIEFVYLKEPQDKRLGRTGIIKFYLEKGELSGDKPKISANASDIIKINVHELAKFQFQGLEKGFLATVVTSSTEVSQFGKLRAEPDTKRVRFFEEKPLTTLPSGEYVNTGLLFVDGKLNNLFLNIEEYPVDWEKSKILPELCKVLRAFDYAVPYKNWIWFHSVQDYKKAKDMDLERFFEITNVERYLGPYSPNNQTL